jgi:hypothetical protein
MISSSYSKSAITALDAELISGIAAGIPKLRKLLLVWCCLAQAAAVPFFLR